jgi:hypothetical protein
MSSRITSLNVTPLRLRILRIVAVADVDGDERERRRVPAEERGRGIGANWPATDVAVVEPGSFPCGFKPDYLFITNAAGLVKDNQFWHSATDLPRLTYRIQPRQPCHMFEWSHCSRRITKHPNVDLWKWCVRLQNTASRVDPPRRDTRVCTRRPRVRTAWSKLAPGSLGYPVALSVHDLHHLFPDSATKRMSPWVGCVVNVLSDASILVVGLFLTRQSGDEVRWCTS